MANYDLTKTALVKHLQSATQRLYDFSKTAIRSGKADGNTISFYTSTDKTGEAIFSFDFPSELVLDQLQTKFIPDFEFAKGSYSGAENPGLEHKPVLVIAIKDTNAKGQATTTYSFLNMETLVDIYTAKDTSINIDGYNINVKISSAANNSLTLKDDGLHVDISGKIDKVAEATAGNIAILKADGTIEDSTHGIATDAEVNAMLEEIFGE